LDAAIDRLTRATASADDDAIPSLVAERRDLREELAASRLAAAGVTSLAEERTK
jgi:hypothetical protein